MGYELQGLGSVPPLLRNSLPGEEAMAQARLDLAAALRMAAHLGLHEGICNHFSAMVPGRDDLFLVNPHGLAFGEVTASSLLVCDFHGNVVEGDWPAPLGIPLHLELHKARHDVQVAMHSHPLYGTVWSDMREVPPVYDQSSGLGGGGDLVLVDEYDGGVSSSEAAAKAVALMGDAELALLAGHGVFILGSTIRAVHQRAVALEQRCQRAWHIRAAAGSNVESSVPQWWLDRGKKGDGNGFAGFWEAMARAELRADPSLLDESVNRRRPLN